jgi:hypothetical protein
MEIMRALFFLISSHDDIPARCIKSRCVTLRIEALYRKPSASPKKPGDSIFFMHTSLAFPEKCRLGWQKITENARHRMSAVAHTGHRSWICHQSVEGTKPTAKYRSIQQALTSNLQRRKCCGWITVKLLLAPLKSGGSPAS